MPLSHYQQAIVNWVATPRPDSRFIFARARAGCGKTSTAVEALKAARPSGRTFPSGDPVPSVLVAAFNNAIRDEIAEECRDLPHVEVKGIHQLGLRCVSAQYGRGIEVDSGRYWRVLIRMVADAVSTPVNSSGLSVEQHALLTQAAWDRDLREVPYTVREAVREAREITGPALKAARTLCDKARLTLTDPRDPDALTTCATKFGVMIPSGWESFVPQAVLALMQHGCWPDAIRADGCIDFVDMIWLPTINDLRPFATFDLVVIDEAQDLSPAQLALALKFCGRTGRGLFLGDDLQSIYAFAGADSRSVPKILETTGATVLPLPVCYRCDEDILKVGRYWASDLEVRPGAGRGLVGIAKGELAPLLRKGDMVLARKNSTLISTLFMLLAGGVPAVIKGRPELTESLIDTAEAIGKRGSIWDGRADDVARRYVEDERAKILAKNRGDESDPVLTELQDRVAAVVALIAGFRATSLEDFTRRIKALFDTTDGSAADNVVTLTSAHRSKGLGAGRVFILAPQDFPMTRAPREQAEDEADEDYADWIETVWMHPAAVARRAEDAQQEANLMYVAVTRAKRELWFVGGLGGFAAAVHAAGVLEPDPTPEPDPEPTEDESSEPESREIEVESSEPESSEPESSEPESSGVEADLGEIESSPSGPPDDDPDTLFGLSAAQDTQIRALFAASDWYALGALLRDVCPDLSIEAAWAGLPWWGAPPARHAAFLDGHYRRDVKAMAAAIRARQQTDWQTHPNDGFATHARTRGDLTALVITQHKNLGEALGAVEIHRGVVSPDPLARTADTLLATGTMRIDKGRRVILTWGEQSSLDVFAADFGTLSLGA